MVNVLFCAVVCIHIYRLHVVYFIIMQSDVSTVYAVVLVCQRRPVLCVSIGSHKQAV